MSGLLLAWGAAALAGRDSSEERTYGFRKATVLASLASHDRVRGLHDLHVWPLSTNETALTVHLLVDHDSLDYQFLAQIQKDLRRDFQIAHSTIQVETAAGEHNCLLDDG